MLLGGICGVLLTVGVMISPLRKSTKTGWDRIQEAYVSISFVVSGFFATAIGGWDPLTSIFALLIIIDYLTGVLTGCMGKSPKTPNGRLSSSVGFKGLMKHFGTVIVVILMNQVDVVTGFGTHAFRDISCWCYISNYLLSIFENLDAMGVWIPPIVKQMLESAREKGQAPKLPLDTNEKKGTGLG